MSLLQGPFSAVVDRHVTDPWLRSLLDLECFVLSGMLAKDTLTAGVTCTQTETGSSSSTLTGLRQCGSLSVCLIGVA